MLVDDKNQPIDLHQESLRLTRKGMLGNILDQINTVIACEGRKSKRSQTVYSDRRIGSQSSDTCGYCPTNK